ncbi:type II secretion system protein GspK [Methylobacterium nonmethylotrophicum]|uniref:General secretion pathway protein GspK n=1 Tax=Methylobacterium nonmethylotrophicum TaxID=1141884 RepID=A0A4Z0NXE2_9HYPH|nr:type II secretion system protein GspK [Methylobacterium nonmethylotrophicum]TGE01239.1 general secretion pathway protein GspK [Methylobacterium nonmethylotrophicum]
MSAGTADRPSRLGEAGFVLPSVLAILLVVAAVAASAVQVLHARGAATSGRAASLRLQGLADGAVRLAATSLVVQHARRLPGLGLPEDGTPILCSWPGGSLVLAVQDQAGLVDLNGAPRTLLEDAFRALGIPDREAAAIAAETVDARDPDDVPEPNGAEAPQYRARGLPGPRNAPFGSVDEIDGLPSVTEPIAALLRRAVTVHNPAGGIDPAVAPAGTFRGTARTEALRHYGAASSHRAYAITAVAASPTRARAGRSAVAAVNAPGIGTGLIAWRFATDDLEGAAPHPACGRILSALDPANDR